MGLLAALGITLPNAAPATKPMALARLGTIGAVAAYVPGEIHQASFAGGRGLAILASSAIWMAIYAIGYSIALAIGQNIYLKRPWLGSRETLVAVLGSAGIGAISGGLAQCFFSLAVPAGQGNSLFVEGSRIAAWALFGGLIGLGMSFVIPNLGRVHGAIGGAAGGAVGAVGFIFSGMVAGDAIGRFIGMAVVGWALGYAIGLVEEVSRDVWLQVTYGNSRESVRVSLGPDLVCVGSNSQRCAVWAQEERPVELRFRYVNGQVTCDDMAVERSMAVKPGFERNVGSLNVIVYQGPEQSVSNRSGQPFGAAAIPGPVSRLPPPPPPRRRS